MDYRQARDLIADQALRILENLNGDRDLQLDQMTQAGRALQDADLLQAAYKTNLPLAPSRSLIASPLSMVLLPPRVTVLSAVGIIRRNIWSEAQVLQCPQRADVQRRRSTATHAATRTLARRATITSAISRG
jgi:hypothetical protein